MRDTKDLQALVKAIATHMPGWTMEVDKHDFIQLRDKNSLCVLNVSTEWQNAERASVTVDWPREAGNITRPENVHPKPEGWEKHPTSETTFAKSRAHKDIARQIGTKLAVAIRQYYECKAQSDENVSRKETCDNAAIKLAATVGGRFDNDKHRRDHEKATVQLPNLIGDVYTYDGKQWSFERGISGITTEKLEAIMKILGE